jgi:mannobiose 2-epimerase
VYRGAALIDVRAFWYIAATVSGLTMTLAPGGLAAGAEPTAGAGGVVVGIDLPPTAASYRQLADATESLLRTDVLDVWFPRAVDDVHAGFHSSFSREWRATPSPDGKFSVFQARMTWMSAQIAMRRPDLKERFLPIARHGLAYLRDVLWDGQDGGFFWGLDDQGKISAYYTDGKHLYGNSFCLYALAAMAQATGDSEALALAKRTFRWIDEHGHDAKNGGYFEWLTRAGKPVAAHPETGRVELVPVAQFPVGYKSMNTHIHLLESFTQLYEVWKDPTVRRRIEELLAIIRDKVSVAPGVMNLYLSDAWVALPGHDSYGHDVEAAYLMLEAEDVLGHGHAAKTEIMAKMLVDHALAYGWDANLGGFFREGPTYGAPEDKKKEWWVQVEGLNALLLMHERHGATTDAYFKAFLRQWRFITDHLRDPEFHGLYEMIDADGRPVAGGKGRIWKEGYHEGRAMLNVNARLQRLAKAAAR